VLQSAAPKQNKIMKNEAKKTMTEKQAKNRVADIEARRANRGLPTQAVLGHLKSKLPNQYELVEIVGRWLWMELPKRERKAANILWSLGFHWNRRRQLWQHPCGAFATNSVHPGDPRDKYGSQYPADL
jgi:hypothetical protein